MDRECERESERADEGQRVRERKRERKRERERGRERVKEREDINLHQCLSGAALAHTVRVPTSLSGTLPPPSGWARAHINN